MVDVQLSDFGSIVVLTPKTDAGLQWIADNVDLAEAQQWAGGIACERRYAQEIALAMAADGIEVDDG